MDTGQCKYIRIIASTEINKIIFSSMDDNMDNIPSHIISLCNMNIDSISSYNLNGFLHIILNLPKYKNRKLVENLASNIYLEEFHDVIDLSKMINISDDPKLQSLLINDIMSKFIDRLADKNDKIKIRTLASKIASTSLDDPIYDALLEISRYIDGFIITEGRLYKKMSILDTIQRIKNKYFKDSKD